MRYEWTNGDRTITVDGALNKGEAEASLEDIVEKYYPDTTVDEWEEV